MDLVKFVTFVVLKIVGNLVSMKNSLNAKNDHVSKISKTVQSKLIFLLNVL